MENSEKPLYPELFVILLLLNKIIKDMGKLFGKHVTHSVAVNELACGEGKFGVKQTYDTYFFGIRTSSGNTRTICYDGYIAGGRGGGAIGFNLGTAKIEKIAPRKFKIEKDSNHANWFRWTCKDDKATSGITTSRADARREARKACNGEIHIEEITVDTVSIVVSDIDIR